MKIVLYAIWALFVIGAALACTQAVRKTRAQERLIAGWPKTQGTVIGSRQGWTKLGNRNVRFWPTYQFVDPRGVLYIDESEVSYTNPPVLGSVIEVAYNPADPHQSFQVDSPSRLVVGCLIPVFGFFAVAAFWFIGFLPLG